MVDAATGGPIAACTATSRQVTLSPYGTDDEIGMLNAVTADSRTAIMARANWSRVYDLSVDNFVGMPGFTAAGDQTYQIWMTHSPGGTVVDNAPNADVEQNELVAYSGDAISMYTHTGTHIDALNHFGYYGKIFNGFTAREHLGSRNWTKGGVDRHPPIVARGLVLDVAALHGVRTLPESYGVIAEDLQGCLQRQNLSLAYGDVVLVRTGQMALWPRKAYADNGPGVNLDGARFLAQAGVALVGADNLSFEQIPSMVPEGEPANWNAVHCYLLGEAGVPIMENVVLDELATDGIDEFAFVAAPIRLRGATGAPVRPIAVPLS